jgi:DNA-binding MarR family transcriptional regulator
MEEWRLSPEPEPPLNDATRPEAPVDTRRPALDEAGAGAGSADPGALATALALAVFHTNGRLVAWGDAFAADLGLTSARWQTLGGIALAPVPCTAPQLAASMGVTRQGAQKQLNLLEADALVARVPNPGHQRSPHYRLTAEGERVYAAVSTRWTQAAAGFAAQLGTPRLAAALQVLRGLDELLAVPAGPESDPATPTSGELS